MTKIELGKTYRTRDGREVRIYAVDGGGPYPVHGAIARDDGMAAYCWTALGKPFLDDHERPTDLIEVKPRIKREVWVNVYPDPMKCGAGATRAEADEWCANDRIACIPITIDCEEGDGL